MSKNYKKKFIIAVSPEIVEKVAKELKATLGFGSMNFEFYWDGDTPVLEVWKGLLYDDGYGGIRRFEVNFKVILDEPEKSVLTIDGFTKEEAEKLFEETLCGDENCPLDEFAEEPKECEKSHECWYYNALFHLFEPLEDMLFGALFKALEEVGLK